MDPVETSKKSNVEIFSAIVAFVQDLWSAFETPKKATPLSLYNRLVTKINFTDKESIEKAIDGFKEFYRSNNTYILNNTLEKIPQDEKIFYGTTKKIYIDIQRFIYQNRNDSDILENIRHHLLTISMLLNPSDKTLAELEKFNVLGLDDDTYEGRFLSDIMKKAQKSMENSGSDDPMQAMMGLIGSGLLPEMISGIKNGVSEGKMSLPTLMSEMQKSMTTLMPQMMPQARITEEEKDLDEEDAERFEDNE